MTNTKVSFGHFKNVEWHTVGGEDTISLIVTSSDNFIDIVRFIIYEGFYELNEKEKNYLNTKVDEIAEDMSEYLTSINIENEIFDNQIGYGQEIDNLVISINKNDLIKCI